MAPDHVIPHVTICRRTSFSCAHRYFQPAFSEEENRAVFGSLYSPHGHGHNFVLEAYLQGRIDPSTGMVMNLKDLDSLLKEVTAPLDHHHLNLDVEYFRERVPTTENIARFCYEELRRRLAVPGVRLVKVRLLEGRDLWVDYTSE